ncbi:MAG: DUF5801 domain-containing protein, partial [Planctomycetales bacterium]
NADDLKVQATLTDGDLDTATATIDLGANVFTIEDDGPSIDVDVVGEPVALVVDESFLGAAGATATASYASNFTVLSSSYGADAAGSLSSAYSLGINAGATGLVDTISGLAVVLLVNAGVVEGHAGSGGPLVFTVSVDSSSGATTLTQMRAVIHNPDSGPDQATSLSTANLVTLTRTDTITDNDGDSSNDSATLNIGTTLVFEDDGPSLIIPADTSLSNEAGASVVGALDIDTNIDDNVGADQLGSVKFINVTDGQETEYTSGGKIILLYLNDDGTILSGRTEGESGPEIFRVTLNQDDSLALSNDNYQVDVFAQVDNGAGVSFEDLSGTGPAG